MWAVGGGGMVVAVMRKGIKSGSGAKERTPSQNG